MSNRTEDYLPTYSAATDGQRLPAYTDSKSQSAQAPRSKFATIKHILSGDAHKNHHAVLEAAATAQPATRKQYSQSTFKHILSGDAHKHHFAVLDAAAAHSSQSSSQDQQRTTMKNTIRFN
ncbi:hypothetical protein B0A48_11884 [Cryoendolithus antarcticus]|uniref:Uncharacterized protein n=1 Tax=Cryoendolithus antarcticus TaxID=1507870 RepID=A0A1V8STE1_9PEZI|nr:hypothetical protein B0A48_11884 [Cryoendolithus antarcticus]